jgi:predicted CXXCH cytochrome family protein
VPSLPDKSFTLDGTGDPVRENAKLDRSARSPCVMLRAFLCAAAALVALNLTAGAARADDAPARSKTKTVSGVTVAPVPLPPPPAPPRPGGASPSVTPTSALTGQLEDCLGCHDGMLRRKVVHAAMQKTACTSCHKPSARLGKCKSASTSAWALTKPQGDLCAACHDAKKLASPFKVKHDFKGRCVECHDAHGSEQPRLLRATGKKLCLSCHDRRSGVREVLTRIDLQRKVVHAALEKNECQDCHDAGHGGAISKLLRRDQPELCYGCHKRKDTGKVVHTAIRQGECLECHDAHSSDLPSLAKRSREQLCLGCHDTEPLLTRSVKHAPVAEGRCLECHEAHQSDKPNLVLGSSKALCLKCHDAKADKRGGVSERMRIDLTRKVVHKAVKEGECTDCHDAGHSGDNPRLLKKNPLDLCYGCHNRKDGQRYTHSAVRLGDCSGCHLPHSSDTPKLVAKATIKDTCFGCHQDDLTGRAVIHKPVAQGKCDECHGPHGAPNRWLLVKGDGKQACYACHRPVDAGKVKHAALERYGCTGCHDPHGTANRFLLARRTNDLCVSCHAAQKDGMHVTAVLASGGRTGHVVSGLLDPRRPDREFSCASCHNPHGSDSQKLFYLGKNSMEMCDGCHGDKSGRHPELVSVIHKARKSVESGSAGGGSGGGADVSTSTLAPATPAQPKQESSQR